MEPKKTTFDDLPDELVSKIIDYAVGDLDDKPDDDLWEKYLYPVVPNWLFEANRLDWQVKADRLWRVSRQFQRSLFDILSKRLRNQDCYEPMYWPTDSARMHNGKHYREYHKLICDLAHEGYKDMDIAEVVWAAPHLERAPEEFVVGTLPQLAWPVKYGCGNRKCYVQRCELGLWLRALGRVQDTRDAKRWQAANRCRRNFQDRRRLRGGRRHRC